MGIIGRFIGDLDGMFGLPEYWPGNLYISRDDTDPLTGWQGNGRFVVSAVSSCALERPKLETHQPHHHIVTPQFTNRAAKVYIAGQRSQLPRDYDSFILPRKVVVFRPSQGVKRKLNAAWK